MVAGDILPSLDCDILFDAKIVAFFVLDTEKPDAEV